MKVLIINGSPRRGGNTALAVEEAASVLQKEGIETETVTIGSKPVRVIDRMAFECTRYGRRRSPEQIILPEGITEIRRGAFLYVEGAEVFFPSTLKTLPEGCFVAVQGLTLQEAADVIAAPFWSTIAGEPEEETRRKLTFLRTVFPSLLITGPFSIVLGFS